MLVPYFFWILGNFHILKYFFLYSQSLDFNLSLVSFQRSLKMPICSQKLILFLVSYCKDISYLPLPTFSYFLSFLTILLFLVLNCVLNHSLFLILPFFSYCKGKIPTFTSTHFLTFFHSLHKILFLLVLNFVLYHFLLLFF